MTNGSPGPEASGVVSVLWGHGAAVLARFRNEPHLRSEVGWVVANKLAELGLLFGLLKILTNVIGKAGYGEYVLAETAVYLVIAVVLSPLHDSFMRDFHGAAERGERRASGLFAIRWYAVVTLGVALAVGLLGGALSELFDVGRYTPVAAGLVFMCERWRWLGMDVLNIQRRRRVWALYNVGYVSLQLVAITVAIHVFPATASTALFAYAAAAAVFSIPVTGPMVRDVLRAPPGRRTVLPSLVWSFGVPMGALLVLQMVQSFADRYLVKGLIDAESVGLYVAAYQVSGIPYIVLLRVFHDLLTPIAYQRGRDVEDPSQIWAADKLLLGGIGVQFAVGLAMLAVYGVIGSQILVFLTNEHFALPALTIVALAASRFLQSISQATQAIFAIHHRVSWMLGFRLFGAVAMVAFCWPLTQAYGLFGAALGSCLALAAYTAVVVVGPGGCWWLVRDVRRRAGIAQQSSPLA